MNLNTVLTVITIVGAVVEAIAKFKGGEGK